MHPLAPDLSSLSNDEVYTKYNELAKRAQQAYRSGNSNLISQIYMLMEDYKLEISNRQQKILDDANKNPTFKNIIDIN